MGIFALLTGQLMSAVKQVVQIRKGTFIQQTLFLKREQVKQYLSNQHSWDSTRANAQNDFSCLGFNCTSGQEFPLQLHDSAGGLFFNSQIPSNGFNIDGKLCTTFDHDNPDPSCPFRMTVYWRPDCGGPANCSKPALSVGVRFEYSVSDENPLGPLNVERFNFELLRQALDNTLESACQSLGGSFDTVTNGCNIQPKLASLGDCGAGKTMTGFSADGTLKCSNLPTAGYSENGPTCPCGTCGQPMCYQRKWDGSCQSSGICTSSGIQPLNQ